MYNTWGGPVEIEASVDNEAHSRNLEMDRASMKSLDPATQSWLLGEEKKEKPSFIDLGCVECSKRLFFTSLCVFLTAGFLAGIIALIVKTAPRKHHAPPVVDNYTLALHQALKFFDAQKSGPLPKSNNITWRGNSGLTDGNWTGGISGYPDLVGGYYDAGDNIKFGFPQSFAMTMLSWSVIEYRGKYIAAGELDHIRQLIKWGTDYMLKTFNSTAAPGEVHELFVQVGKGHVTNPDDPLEANDHACWNIPEQMNYDRPCYRVSSAPEVGAEMAAALASASIVFGDDPDYSKKLLDAATAIFFFAKQQDRTPYMNAGATDAAEFYNSTGYFDEHLWGGAWMYYATGNKTYLLDVTNQERAENAHYSNTSAPAYGVLSWDNKLLAVQLLLTRLTLFQDPGYPYKEVLSDYHNHTDIVMCSYLPQYGSYKRTNGGLMMVDRAGNPGTMFYSVNSVFIAALYADYMDEADVRGWYCGNSIFQDFHKVEELRVFARSQMDYILGKNPSGMSYVVGFGKKYPRRLHHRGASTPSGKTIYECKDSFRWLNSDKDDPHILYGALVGGQHNTSDDSFKDDRLIFTNTEPTLHGNAGLVAALVALSEVDSPNTPKLDVNTIFSNIPPMYAEPPPPPPVYKP